jgi:hypothetical protein
MHGGVLAILAVVLLAACSPAMAAHPKVLVLSVAGERIPPGATLQWYSGETRTTLEGAHQTVTCFGELSGGGKLLTNGQRVDELSLTLGVELSCAAFEENGHDTGFLAIGETPVKLAAHGVSRMGISAPAPTMHFEDGCAYTAPKLRLATDIERTFITLAVSGEFRRTSTSPRSCERSWHVSEPSGELEAGFRLVETAVEAP